MTTRRLFSLLFITALALTGVVTAQQKSLAVVVSASASQWPDTQLEGSIRAAIAGRNGFDLAERPVATQMAPELGTEFHLDRVVAAGLKAEQRYVLWCHVTEEQLRIEKAFGFPFLIKQRRITARLALEYRIVDCFRGRIVGGERLEFKQHGPSAMQIADFTDADPNLFMTYTERKDLFDRLEQRAAEAISNSMLELASLR